MTEKRSC